MPRLRKLQYNIVKIIPDPTNLILSSDGIHSFQKEF